jgi:exportin-1
MKFSEDETIM